jgi:cell division protein FtsL
MTRPERVTKMVGARNSRTGVRVKNSRTKKKQPFLSARQVFLIIALLFVFMGSGITYVWSTFEKTQIGYDLSRLKKEEMKLRETHRRLELELAFLKSPENLTLQAIKKLGLRPPAPGQIIVLPR